MTTRNETIWICDGEGCEQEVRGDKKLPISWAVVSIQYYGAAGAENLGLRILHLCKTCSPKAHALGTGQDFPGGRISKPKEA